MASATLILLWVHNEISYDDFHPNKDRIYQAWNRTTANGRTNYWQGTPRALGPALLKEYPGIANTARMDNRWFVTAVGEKKMSSHSLIIDPSFLSIFHFPLVRGNAATVLDNSSSIVITESFAKKLFGKDDPMARTIKVNEYNFVVPGILKDLPANKDINFEFLFGTGMGAGLILDGRLFSGTTDLAGEVGHLRLAEMGPVSFGKAGSFEGFCSGGGIAQLAQTKVRGILQMGGKVSFCKSIDDLPLLSAKLVAEAAYKGDEVALDIYRTCGRYLGRGLSLLIDILNPEIIILGSIFGRAKSLMEPYMKEVILQETLADSNAVCQIVPAALGEHIGDMAALTLAEMCNQTV